ncbi:hypothetical protein NEOLEDRAFT_1238635 [Neolentinus lepideus HHB14362 ss-1]|uniref:Uncharacterized protein n=1 Tax=Neolentinus lepideus HHB14362 ss-1 TaxID=1314782 RepID=A0A165VMT6_9AGAM|nr:hypothetical protein NEOLEDRAFT_1238635 [Neolentinus lepideus HHB14362 ss-1]
MSFQFYQNAGDGWGTSQYRFGPPPVPSFQPQPHWRGWDFFRSHAVTRDRAILESALDRVRNYEGAAGVGIDEARRFHRMIYGGLVDITTAHASEIGHAAAYEAFRIWRHHSFVCSPLGGDLERQRECMMALAIAESTRLCQYTGRIVDRIDCQVAADAAASTASLIFSQTDMGFSGQQNAQANQMDGMNGNMGGRYPGQMGGMDGMGMNPGMSMSMGGVQGPMGGPGVGTGMNPMMTGGQYGMGGIGSMGIASGMGSMGGMGPMGGMPGRYGGMGGGGGMQHGSQSPYIYDDRYAYAGTPTLPRRISSAPGSPMLSRSGGTPLPRGPTPVMPRSGGASPYAGPVNAFAGAGNPVNELANGVAVGGAMANGMGSGFGPSVGSYGAGGMAYGPGTGIGGARSMPGSPYLGAATVIGAGVNPVQMSQPVVGGAYPGSMYVQGQPAGTGLYGGGTGVGGYTPGYAGQAAGGGLYPGQAGYGYGGGRTYPVQPPSTINIVTGSGRRHRSRRHSTAGYY